MATLGGMIALLTASKDETDTIEERLDALLVMMRAAEEGRLSIDAIEVLGNAGLGLDERRDLTDQLKTGRITMAQVEEAVRKAKHRAPKARSARPQTKAS